MILTKLIYLLILFFILIEISHQLRTRSPLVLKPKKFKIEKDDSSIKYITCVEITNLHKNMEVMIPAFNITPFLIGISKDQILSLKTEIKALHPDEVTRNDDYWSAYILKSKKSTIVRIQVEIKANNLILNKIECLWIDIKWINYGPFGKITKYDGFLLANQLITGNNKYQEKVNNYIEPIKTHILGVLDDPISILEAYLPKNILSTDTITIGETPLAIMQGRYIDYRTINTSLLAKILCKGFHPTSSLATACGLQTLININRPSRIILASFLGFISKIFGTKGLFYRLAGHQARLIDDITGTTPPYDKSIVLGPHEPKQFCTEASKKLGINVAVVDVNDLGRVKVISASQKSDLKAIQSALVSNPAGNANQHTPLVLIRTKSKLEQSHRVI